MLLTNVPSELVKSKITENLVLCPHCRFESKCFKAINQCLCAVRSFEFSVIKIDDDILDCHSITTIEMIKLRWEQKWFILPILKLNFSIYVFFFLLLLCTVPTHCTFTLYHTPFNAHYSQCSQFTIHMRQWVFKIVFFFQDDECMSAFEI